MLKLVPNIVTRVQTGHGTYLYHIKHSESFFLPLDSSRFFSELTQGVNEQDVLVDALIEDYECSSEEALSAVLNTLDSLTKSELLEK